MWDGFNKRKFPRLNLSCEIQIQTADKGESLTGTTENVGLGGVCVIVDRPLERFAHCRVKLDLPEDAPINCDGKIVWIVPTHNAREKKEYFDVGIEFVNLSPESRDLLKKRVESAPNL